MAGTLLAGSLGPREQVLCRGKLGHVGVYVLPAADPVPDPPRFGPKASGSSQVPKRLEAPPGTPKKAPPKRERERSVSI